MRQDQRRRDSENTVSVSIPPLLISFENADRHTLAVSISRQYVTAHSRARQEPDVQREPEIPEPEPEPEPDSEPEPIVWEVPVARRRPREDSGDQPVIVQEAGPDAW